MHTQKLGSHRALLIFCNACPELLAQKILLNDRYRKIVLVQAYTTNNPRMAIPYPIMQPPLYQRPPALMPSDLLAAIDGWESGYTWGPADMGRLASGGTSRASLPPSSISPLEGAGRMAQDGGVIAAGSFDLPKPAGNFKNMILLVDVIKSQALCRLPCSRGCGNKAEVGAERGFGALQ